MQLTRILLACAFILLMTNLSLAKEWRGIVPLHSNCEDVKRLLDVTKCETGTYYFKDENAFISFSDKAFDERESPQYNVPPGTVMSIFVHRKPAVRLADLKIDEARYRIVPSKHVDALQYIDDTEGFIITVFKGGEVLEFYYGPTKKDDSLLCERVGRRNPQH